MIDAKIEKKLLEWAKSIEQFVIEGLQAEPSSQQTDGLRAIDAGQRRISIKSGHGCFAKGTEILKYDGSVCNVEDIKTGDQLLGDDSTRRNVLELYRGRENMYRFTLNDGVVYEFNESHILCLVATQSHGRQQKGDKITVTVRDWLQWSDRKKRTHAFYRKPITRSYPKELPVDAYTLGVWLGDGGTDKDVVWLGPKKQDVLNLIDAQFVAHENGCSRYKLNIAPQLREMGLLQGTKFIPKTYLNAGREIRLLVLAGMLDTDGSVDRYSYEWSTKFKQLAKDMQYLIKSVGCHTTIKTKVVKGVTYYRLSISRNIGQIPTTRLKTPSNCKRQRNNLHFGIRSVEYLGEGDYYGFELDGNHKFLGADFSVLHNTGKTSFLAWAIIWVGLFKDDAKNPCTAPTAPQLRSLLLPEVAKWREKLPEDLRDQIRVNTEGVSFATGNATTARTARKENPESLQGFHASFLFWVVDEASGVHNSIFEVMDGSLTGSDDLVLLTANPTRTDGYFYDTHHKNRDLWHCLTFNAEKSENVSKESIERKKRQYGEDSDAYRVRVLGEFPRSNSMAVIPLYLLEEAMQREEFNDYGPEVWGLDYADAGDDKTWLCKRIGHWIYEFKECPVQGSHRQSKTAAWLANEYMSAKRKPRAIFTDAIGEGSGLVSRLNDVDFENIPVVPVKASESSSKPQFRNKRAEMLYGLKAILEEEGKIIEDDDFIGEILAHEFDFTATGKLVVTPKDKIKEELGRSPDKADAAMLSCNVVIIDENERMSEYDVDYALEDELYGEGGW